MFAPQPHWAQIPPRCTRPPLPKGAFGSPPLTKEGQGGFRHQCLLLFHRIGSSLDRIGRATIYDQEVQGSDDNPTLAIERALELVISEAEKDQRTWAATEKLIRSGIQIQDVFSRLDTH